MDGLVRSAFQQENQASPRNRDVNGHFYLPFSRDPIYEESMIMDRKRTSYNYDLILSTLGEIGVVTRSATRKPHLAGGDKGCNKKQTASLPESPALWPGRFPDPADHPSGGWRFDGGPDPA
jgi:hypothetical protein